MKEISINYGTIHATFLAQKLILVELQNNFEFKIINCQTDNTGNLILLNIKINNDFTITLINIYAPNTDDPDFFINVKDLILQSSSDYCILCGDFNLVLNPQLDSMNYVNLNNPSSRKVVLNMIENLNLVDTFRHFCPDKRRYTWRKSNPVKQARLDYF